MTSTPLESAGGEPMLWPHLDRSEVERRIDVLNAIGFDADERSSDIARSVLTLQDLLESDGEELSVYAGDPGWMYAGGASWLSLRWGDMKAMAADGSWLEGEAAELSTPRERFEVLVDIDDMNLWTIMAANPACPGDIIHRIATSPEVDYESQQIWYCSAENPGTPVATLLWLIRVATEHEDEDDDDFPDYEVRQLALRNPALPADAMREWAQPDKGWMERSAVAGNPGLSVELLRELAADAHWGVREAVAKNPCTPPTLLKLLSEDDEKRVRDAARANRAAGR